MIHKRARFIDADGRSFFDEIGENVRYVYERMVPVDLTYALEQAPNSAALHLKREVYCREVWFVPCGPLACPIGAPGEQLDVVFRFDRVDG